MSVRPSDALAATQNFSLRDVVSNRRVSMRSQKSTRTQNAPLRAQVLPFRSQAVTPLLKQTPQLNLGFGSKPAEKPVEPQSETKTLNNLRFTPAKMSPMPIASADPAPLPLAKPFVSSTSSSDVMRLTAYVDDLSKKLQMTQSKLQQSESRLSRTNQVLTTERQSVHTKIASFKADLKAAHDIEMKLRTELAARPAKNAQELSTTKFQSSVQSILMEEESLEKCRRHAAELQAKVNELEKSKAILEADLANLTKLKSHLKQEIGALNEKHSEIKMLAKKATEELADNEELLNASRARIDAKAAEEKNYEDIEKKAEEIFDGIVNATAEADGALIEAAEVATVAKEAIESTEAEAALQTYVPFEAGKPAEVAETTEATPETIEASEAADAAPATTEAVEATPATTETVEAAPATIEAVEPVKEKATDAVSITANALLGFETSSIQLTNDTIKQLMSATSRDIGACGMAHTESDSDSDSDSDEPVPTAAAADEPVPEPAPELAPELAPAPKPEPTKTMLGLDAVVAKPTSRRVTALVQSPPHTPVVELVKPDTVISGHFHESGVVFGKSTHFAMRGIQTATPFFMDGAEISEALRRKSEALAPSKEVTDPTTLMIQAVVGDLKQKLTELSSTVYSPIAVAPLA